MIRNTLNHCLKFPLHSISAIFAVRPKHRPPQKSLKRGKCTNASWWLRDLLPFQLSKWRLTRSVFDSKRILNIIIQAGIFTAYWNKCFWIPECFGKATTSDYAVADIKQEGSSSDYADFSNSVKKLTIHSILCWKNGNISHCELFRAATSHGGLKLKKCSIHTLVILWNTLNDCLKFHLCLSFGIWQNDFSLIFNF